MILVMFGILLVAALLGWSGFKKTALCFLGAALLCAVYILSHNLAGGSLQF